MKRKPSMLAYTILLLAFFMMPLAYVYTKLSIDELKKKKISVENEILVMREDEVKLDAEHQFLSSEGRIRSLASTQLGMVFNPVSIETIKISAAEIEELKTQTEIYEQR